MDDATLFYREIFSNQLLPYAVTDPKVFLRYRKKRNTVKLWK